MALWTDIIEPAVLTGYARAAMADYEAQRGTLARYLPNSVVADTAVRFMVGEHGLVDIARYRAYDAEPEIGRGPGGRRVTIDLPAISQEIPVSEYQQLRTRRASDETVLESIQKTARNVVRAIADGIERTRGVVLATGIATIDQDNFKSEDDFGRPPEHTVDAAVLWNATGADPLGDLGLWKDVYVASNGEEPGSIVMSTQAFRALAAAPELQIQLGNGASRQAGLSEINTVVAAEGLPPITIYDRQVSVNRTRQRVLPPTHVLLLPAPVDPTDVEGTDLGATFWGETLTGTDPDYAIEDADQPGLVVGVHRNEKPPMIAEVIGDAIALPVLANAALSLSAKVL